MSTYGKLKEKYGDALPDSLPGKWVFPAPPVCTSWWSNHDWIAFAAKYNGFTL